MPFVAITGVSGKLFVPEKSNRLPCKHSCPDCFSCQLCSDDRCHHCRGSTNEPAHAERQRPAVTASD